MTSPASSRAGRPSLGRNSMTGGSFIDDHQQYKSGFAGPGSSIDGVLEAPFEPPIRPLSDLSLSPHKSQIPAAIASSSSLIRDSGIVHSISHAECVRSNDDSAGIVATIFYNSSSPRHVQIHPDQVSTHLLPDDISNLPPYNNIWISTNNKHFQLSPRTTSPRT